MLCGIRRQPAQKKRSSSLLQPFRWDCLACGENFGGCVMSECSELTLHTRTAIRVCEQLLPTASSVCMSRYSGQLLRRLLRSYGWSDTWVIECQVQAGNAGMTLVVVRLTYKSGHDFSRYDRPQAMSPDHSHTTYYALFRTTVATTSSLSSKYAHRTWVIPISVMRC
jgi:hypothetical protein